MSANVVWYPDKPKKTKDLGFTCPSKLGEKFDDAFGRGSLYSLGEHHLPVIRGMMAGEVGSERRAYQRLIDAIETVGDIIVEWID